MKNRSQQNIIITNWNKSSTNNIETILIQIIYNTTQNSREDGDKPRITKSNIIMNYKILEDNYITNIHMGSTTLERVETPPRFTLHMDNFSYISYVDINCQKRL